MEENEVKMSIKPTIKKYLFPIMSTVLARPIYAMSNGLSRIRSTSVRKSVLFDSITCNLHTPLIYSKFGPEHFVIDTRDQVISRGIFATGAWEFGDCILALKLLERHKLYRGNPTLLIDVGANIGPICILAVARGYFERAIAIEPHPHNCRLLRTNIALNGLTETIAVYESACGMFDNERLELALSEDNFGDHRIQSSDVPRFADEYKRRKIPIESNKLDTLCPFEPGKNTLIWIDTQGYEGYVLAGAGSWLDARTPLVVEFWPDGMKRVNSFELMKTALTNYEGFYDLWRNPSRFRPIGDLDDLYEELHKAGELGELGFTDLLVIGTR
jgi:FkbM family methyltransferase